MNYTLFPQTGSLMFYIPFRRCEVTLGMVSYLLFILRIFAISDYQFSLGMNDIRARVLLELGTRNSYLGACSEMGSVDKK